MKKARLEAAPFYIVSCDIYFFCPGAAAGADAAGA